MTDTVITDVRPTIHILVGLPGSGKSTWRAKHIAANPTADPVTVSTDDMIDEYATEHGLTYSEAWDKVNMSSLNTRFKYLLRDAVKAGRNIIVDRTNMGAKARREILKEVTETYTSHAVIFVVTDEVLVERLKTRAETTGKVIPEFVIKSMAGRYVRPTREEGFDTIQTVRD
jgi:heterogeneous nuclear ribonucleoprotein U-like protein 1